MPNFLLNEINPSGHQINLSNVLNMHGISHNFINRAQREPGEKYEMHSCNAQQRS